MTPNQIELARHALGLPNKRKCSYRNYFVAGKGNDDYADWLAMADGGFAVRRNGSALSGGDDIFYLTRAGANAALKRGERLDSEDFSPFVSSTPGPVR